MKYLSIILLILICSCNNANQKTQSVPIDTTENDSEDEVYTPSVHKDHVNIDSIINNSGYKLKGTIGCILWDSTEFNGIGTATSPFHLKAKRRHSSKKVYESGEIGNYLYLPLTTEDTVDAIYNHGYGVRLGKGVVFDDTTKKGIAVGDPDETIIWSHGDTSQVIRMDIDGLNDSVVHGWHIYSLKMPTKWLWRSYPAYLDSSFNKD